ncbi:hypothetical protein PRUPE_4G224200 [Prunus persica]|uniref:Uncharacterized protein n=1 Tax=Prunus persica TaxID=3760 RepID=A0A251PPM8_PRUPE|nr:hypothetical protein PRUPE_4G224200 [Prunus persica]
MYTDAMIFFLLFFFSSWDSFGRGKQSEDDRDEGSSRRGKLLKDLLAVAVFLLFLEVFKGGSTSQSAGALQRNW